MMGTHRCYLLLMRPNPKPKTWKEWFVSRMATVVDRERYSHCAISDGQTVLDPTFYGDRMHPLDVFLRACPVERVVEIHTPEPIRLMDSFDSRPKPIWPTFIRWLTGGRFCPRSPPTCAESVVYALDTGGIYLQIPQKVLRISALVRMIEHHEYITDQVG